MFIHVNINESVFLVWRREKAEEIQLQQCGSVGGGVGGQGGWGALVFILIKKVIKSYKYSFNDSCGETC